MRRIYLLTALVAAAMFCPMAAAAQQHGGAIPIRDAFVDANDDRVPDRLGDTVVVVGVLTSDPLVIGENAALANFQDATAGAILFTRDTLQLRRVSAGNSLRIRGRVGQYRGAEQLLVHAYEVLGHPGAPEPRDVLVRQLHDEGFSGQLVRVEGRLITTATPEHGLEVHLEDRTGAIPVTVSGRWITDPEFLARVRRGGKAELVGVASQSTRSDPPVDGYRLIPRRPTDFSFAPVPPYDLLAAAAGVLLILGLVLWRRATARRARKLEALAAQLERSREEIRIREARFRSLVENAADTVSILDADGVITYHSPSVTRMLGWTPEELVGRSAFELVHPEDHASVLPVFAELVRDEEGVGREVEFRFQARDGSWRDLEVLGTNRIHDPAVQGIVCNVRDVTHHRELEIRLRQADRLESVGRLAGGVAHDFNNILTALAGHAEMALEEMPPGAAGRAEITEIVRNTDRAAALTRHLLAFSRQQVRETRPVSARSIIGGLLPTLRRVIGADIEIAVDLGGPADTINADPTQIEQVVLNLIINARDAMPEGGRITVSVAEDAITEPGAARYPYVVKPGPYVRISVVDTGTGMSPEVLSRVFEPFFTTKEPGHGTGLGLASVYGIVKQSHGYVWVDSAPGAGTRFDIYLPRLDRPAPDETREEAAQPALVCDEGGGTILLAEDEQAVRKLAARVLRKNGYRVLEGSDAEEALRLAEGNPEIDLLLTDVVMPGLSGIELARRLRERLPDIPVLLMSGYTGGELVERTDQGESFPLLEKPFTPAELVHRVNASIPRAGNIPTG